MVQPLPCPFCDRIFKQDGRLKEHLKNKHAGEELQESGALEEGSDPAPESASTSESVQNSQRDEHGYPIKTPKTLLHEWCQKNKKPQPKFKAVSDPYLVCYMAWKDFEVSKHCLHQILVVLCLLITE